MKKLFTLLGILMIVGLAGQAQAITAHTYAENIGYSQADFIIDTADPDSATKQITLFWGTSLTTVTRKDSLTSSITDPDTISKAVGTFVDGTTIYWYVTVEDSTTTITIPSDGTFKTFTTTDFTQNLTITTGYSTALIIHDSVGFYVAPLDSLIFRYGTVSETYPDSSVITSVTHPDSVALTGLMEGGTYYGIMVAFLADSSIVDSTAEYTFTTTDLQYSVTVLRFNLDSLFLIADTVNADLAVDSLMLQWGAGLAAIANTAETITSVTEPDTFVIVGLIEGGTYHYRVKAFLPDSSAIETTTVATYTRVHNKFVENTAFRWPDNFTRYEWDFDGASDDYSTNPLSIKSGWLRIHLAIDGEDDVSSGDSIQAFLWSWEFGDSTIIDTLVPMENDTITITPLKYRMYPSDYSDTSLVLYPWFDWGTHYSISATMVDTTIYEDSTLGIRSVHVLIEEID